MKNRTLREAYRSHKSRAVSYGIPFLLTFYEWAAIWEESGHLLERGRKKGQYVMARFGDTGPYSTDNVKIITNADNIREAHVGKEGYWKGKKDPSLSKYQKVRMKGTRNPSSKLTPQQVLEIWRLGNIEGISQRSIAESYPITQTSVGKILRGISYSEITKHLRRVDNL